MRNVDHGRKEDEIFVVVGDMAHIWDTVEKGSPSILSVVVGQILFALNEW